MFVGFFGNFVSGLGNILPSAFDGVAGSEDCGRATENDEEYESHSQFASHKNSLDDGLYRHANNVRECILFPIGARDANVRAAWDTAQFLKT